MMPGGLDFPPFTPAERQVMHEQIQTLQMHLKRLAICLQGGDSEEIVSSYILCLPPQDFLGELVKQKINHGLYDCLREGR